MQTSASLNGRDWSLPPNLACVQQVSAFGDLSPYFSASGGISLMRVSHRIHNGLFGMPLALFLLGLGLAIMRASMRVFMRA